jgi:hypothetical protein
MKRTALLLLATTALFLGACTANTEAGEDPAAEVTPSLEVASPAQEAREAARIKKVVQDPTMKLKLKDVDPSLNRRPADLGSILSPEGDQIVRPSMPIEVPGADPTTKRAPAANDLVQDDVLDPSETRAPALDDMTAPPNPKETIRGGRALRDMQNGDTATLCASCN